MSVCVCARVWVTLKLCVKSTPYNAENKNNVHSVLNCSPQKKILVLAEPNRL